MFSYQFTLQKDTNSILHFYLYHMDKLSKETVIFDFVFTINWLACTRFSFYAVISVKLFLSLVT